MKGPGIVSKHWPMLHKIMHECTHNCVRVGGVKMSINKIQEKVSFLDSQASTGLVQD